MNIAYLRGLFPTPPLHRTVASTPSIAVVILTGVGEPSGLQDTLDALDALALPTLKGVWTLGASAATDRAAAVRPDGAAPLRALTSATVRTSDLGGADHVAFLRCGDRPTSAAFAGLKRDRRRGLRTGVYALVPDAAYVLSPGAVTKSTVAIDRDKTTTWVGSAGFVLRGSLLDNCHTYDLHGSMALESLFLEAVLHAGRYQPVPEAVSITAALEDTLTVEACLYDPGWYFGLNTTFETLFAEARTRHGAVPTWLEYSYLYLLQWRIAYNRNSANKAILRGEDLETFQQGIAGLLAGVPDDVVLASTRSVNLDFNTRLYLLKANGADARLTYRYYTDDVALVLDSTPILSATACRLSIEVMNIEHDTLQLSARFTFPMDRDSMTITATYAGTVHEARFTERYADSRAFGELIYRTETVDFEIPLVAGESHELHFHMVCEVPGADPGRVHLNPTFRRASSRLTPDPDAYWADGPYLLRYTNMGISVSPTTGRAVLDAELAFARRMVAARSLARIRVIVLRALFYLTRPYFRRRTIWIYYDKIYKAGDNGEYAYRHALTHHDGIHKYYFLRPDVPDAARFERDGIPFVAFGSLRHKLVFLNADIVFTTHIGPPNYGGFSGGSERLYRGLYHYQVVCIQHGLSVQDLADTLNRVYDNIRRYCLASPVEKANLSQPAYDYRDEQLVLTGLARYDGLVDDDRRQILIAPTWRNYLAGPANMGHSRSYSRAFAESPYCTIYNSLINDERLLRAARQYGYRVILLLHPVTSSQLADFHGNDVVEVIASTDDVSYEQLLTQSSLMITDYSGIQFDFAYMYKPIVYFHPPQLPPAYDEGTYHYDTMALGEVCTDIDAVVTALEASMARECAITDEYSRRIDEFFAFHDRSSSQRIYEVGLGLDAETRKDTR